MDVARRLIVKTAAAALLACAGGVLTATAALAAEDPIPGVDVVVEKVPPGNAIANVRTDKDGIIAFRSLEAGGYRVRDRAGDNSASIKHKGGPARWRLVQSMQSRKPVWSLVDVSEPM